MELAAMTDEDLPPPPTASSSAQPLGPPPVITAQGELNWPQRNVGESYFDRALAAGAAEGDETGYSVPYANGEVQEDAWADEGANGVADDAEAGAEDEGWDLDAEVIDLPVDDAQPESAGVEGDLSDVSPGVNEDEQWTRNSPLAADHAAAGSFDTAMQVSARLPIVV